MKPRHRQLAEQGKRRERIDGADLKRRRPIQQRMRIDIGSYKLGTGTARLVQERTKSVICTASARQHQRQASGLLRLDGISPEPRRHV